MCFCIVFTLFSFGCKAQKKESYIVLDIRYEVCFEFYYFLKLKSVNNDSTFQIISKKCELNQGDIEVEVGDKIEIQLEKIERSDKEIYTAEIRGEKYVYFCNEEKILEATECFYKSKHLIGLTLVD